MNLQHLNEEAIGLKTATTLVQIKRDGSIRVGDKSIEGPGEYDVASVGIHAFPDYAILFTEGIRLGVVWNETAQLDPEENSNSDIFIFLMADLKQINTIVKEQDPRIVVFHDTTTAEALAKQDGVELVRESSYKVSQQSLPSEERVFVLLS
jgi:hypothetical protein